MGGVDPMLGLIAVLMAASFAVLFWGVRSFAGDGEKSAMKSRVERLQSVPEELKAELGGLGGEPQAERKSLLSTIDLRPSMSRFTGDSYFNEWEAELARADIPLRVSEFLILRFALVVFLSLVVMVLAKSILFGLLTGVIVAFAHAPILGVLKGMRINKFVVQLSDYLILIVNSLRAGQTFMQGCSVAVQESPNPIAAEFKQVIKEVNLGLPEVESLENMTKRVPSEDINIVVSAYIIQRKVGGNLAEIFETAAATIRERIKIQGQINVLTTQGKLSGAIISAMPFVIGLIINAINPQYMQPLFTHPIGWGIIGLGLVMQLIGILLIWKIVSIDI